MVGQTRPVGGKKRRDQFVDRMHPPLLGLATKFTKELIQC